MKHSNALIAVAGLSVAAVVTPLATASAQTAQPDAIVDIMRTLSGKQKARPSGAKGQCFVGVFTPTAEAKGLTKSASFAKPSRVVARFSVGGGNPKVADATKTVNRGFSFRIDDGGAATTEFVMVNAPINFVKSPDQMLAFLQARLPGADGKPDADKIKAFTDANPETTGQGRYLAGKPVVGSWVGVSYWAIHPYTFTNAAGAKQLVKFRMAPTAGEVTLTEDAAKAKPADFLLDELKGRIDSKAAASFDMLAIIGRAGDEKTNATQQWDDEDKRPTIKVGTLAITAVEKNETCDGTIFNPTNLADGLAGPVNDPLFTDRTPAYAVSIGQRF
ncbi:MAG: catalase [Beijerinckiaceae bacterium]